MKTRFPAAFYIILTLLIITSASASALLMTASPHTGLAFLAVSAALFIASLIAALLYSRNSIRHISRMNSHLESSAAEYMNSLPAPVAVLGEDRQCVWYNQIFIEKISLGQDLFGYDLCGIVNLDIDGVVNNGFSYCSVNGAVYRVTAERFAKNDISFLVLYFHDETQYYLLKKSSDAARPNVVVITIDNYDDIMQNAKESEKAQASVETERLIEKFMNGTNGFIKKTSSNTFYAVLENRHIDSIIAGKFHILEEARAIKINGNHPLTFSIGVGLGAETLAESERLARQCLDMALGRGGDQAVVKTDTGYRFFGGVSTGVEKRSRSKTRTIANALQDLVLSSGRVFIMGHRFGDLDSVGASCGMAAAIQLLGKEAFIAVDRAKNLASHLIDVVEQQVESELFISPGAAESAITENDLLIVADTHNKDFLESRALYDKAKQVVVIDHHRKTVNFIDNAVLFHHEPYASSASEMVTELIQYFRFPPDSKIPDCCADALLAGIMLDTKNFVMRTGSRTFEAAAFLKKLGADTIAVKLLFSNSIDSYRRRTQIVASAKIHQKCAIAVADFKSDDIRLVAPQAADELLGITDVDAAFVLYKTGNTVNISARSLGAMNVQVIMEQLGGGGHQTMAATQIEGGSIHDAAEALIRVIDAHISNE